jgi:5-methyltetrahydrofolate--homocysteine methyltransferase
MYNEQRILILDGAMGSMIRARYPSFHGCNDELCLTQAELIASIHQSYLEAGADIIETCSFNATPVSLAEYGLAADARKISCAAASIARKTADDFAQSHANKKVLVAGSIGPTAKSASIPCDITNPSQRAIGWDELESGFYENAAGLLDGGADLFLIETIFDTLNAKAAIAAIARLFEERGKSLPVMLSATVNEGGRLLGGQGPLEFLASIEHAQPWSAGLNCSFGAEKLITPLRLLASAAPCRVHVYPNAGLPDSAGAYNTSPASMADALEPYFAEGLLNIVGGCCGSTPDHIAAIAGRASKFAGRKLSAAVKSAAFTNVFSTAQNAAFDDLIAAADYEGAAEELSEGVEEKEADAALIRIDDADTMSAFIRTALFYPDLARLPLILESNNYEAIEAGLKCIPAKAYVSTAALADRDSAVKVQRYGARLIEPAPK